MQTVDDDEACCVAHKRQQQSASSWCGDKPRHPSTVAGQEATTGWQGVPKGEPGLLLVMGAGGAKCGPPAHPWHWDGVALSQFTFVVFVVWRRSKTASDGGRGLGVAGACSCSMWRCCYCGDEGGRYVVVELWLGSHGMYSGLSGKSGHYVLRYAGRDQDVTLPNTS